MSLVSKDVIDSSESIEDIMSIGRILKLKGSSLNLDSIFSVACPGKISQPETSDQGNHFFRELRLEKRAQMGANLGPRVLVVVPGLEVRVMRLRDNPGWLL